MKSIGPSAAALAALLLGTGAIAAQTTMPRQTTSPARTMTPPQATPTTTPSATPSPSATPQTTPTPAAPLTSADINDAEVNQFATAVVAVNKVQQDTTVADADKQPKMMAAVTTSGLTAQRFNAIAKASQADPALMTRIQTAAAAQMKAAPATK